MFVWSIKSSAKKNLKNVTLEKRFSRSKKKDSWFEWTRYFFEKISNKESFIFHNAWFIITVLIAFSKLAALWKPSIQKVQNTSFKLKNALVIFVCRQFTFIKITTIKYGYWRKTFSLEKVSFYHSWYKARFLISKPAEIVELLAVTIRFSPKVSLLCYKLLRGL